MKLFEPDSDTSRAARAAEADRTNQRYIPYVYPPKVALAVRVAQATGRPALLVGDPGCGKSSLARDVAVCLGYRYVEEVVTSRTAARDLLWRFDHVRRLGDPIAKKDELRHYVEPGKLWWAFDPASAKLRGADQPFAGLVAPHDPTQLTTDSKRGVVVLLDEIDKAEPDVPNDLLVPMGEMRFDIDDPPTNVRRADGPELLVFITSNGERELPGAFQRRCLLVEVPRPKESELRDIVRAHFPDTAKVTDDLIGALIGRLETYADKAKGLRKPGTAEFLDAVRACEQHGIASNEHPLWDDVTRLTMWKYPG